MALADTARLIASLELDPRKFTKGLSAADKALGKTEGRAYKAGQQIGTGIKNLGRIAAVGFGVVAANVALGIDSLIKLENAQAQTNAVIKSTGGIAKISADEVGRLAEKYEGLNATIGDEVIRSGENLLLTFRNIRGKAFEPTLRAALDMNTALGKEPEGLSSTVTILGKALNDPTKGLAKLQRVGVTFSKAQVKRITALQKEGKLYEAQKIIIGELDQKFGGSFLAGGNTTAGKVAKFTDAIEDLQRALAEALLPAIGEIADALTTLLNDPATKRGVSDLGKDIAKLFSSQNIKAGAKIVGDVIKAIRDAAPDIKAGLGAAADIIGRVVDEFKKLPPDVQKLAIGALVANKLTGGLITNLGSSIVGAILGQLKSAVVNVQGAVVNVNGAGGIPGGGTPGAAGKGLGDVVKAAPAAIGLTGAASLTIAAIAPLALGELALAISQAATGKTPQQLTDEGHLATAVARGMKPEVVPSLNRLPGVFDKPLDQIIADNKARSGDALKIANAQDVGAENRAARQIRATDAFKTQASRDSLKEQRVGERTADSGLKTYQAVLDSKRALTDAAKETNRETNRGLTATAAAANKTASNVNTFHQELAAVNRRMSGEITGHVDQVRDETRRANAATAAAARAAGERARAGALAAADAIRKKNLVANVTVVNKLNLSIRDTQRKLSFSQNMAIYG